MTKENFPTATATERKTREYLERTSFEDYLDYIYAAIEEAVQEGRRDTTVARCPHHITTNIISFLKEKGYETHIYLMGGWTNTLHIKW